MSTITTGTQGIIILSTDLILRLRIFVSFSLCFANTSFGRHSLGHGFFLDCLCFGSQGVSNSKPLLNPPNSETIQSHKVLTNVYLPLVMKQQKLMWARGEMG